MKKLRETVRKILHEERDTGGLSPFLCFLTMLSVLYSGVIGLRNHLYNIGLLNIKKLSCKVISVGNITVGGTGKTPMVIMLAQFLKENGYKPVILSRGYGGKRKQAINVVSDGKNIFMGPARAGDEPLLIAQSLDGVPVVTGAERCLTGTYAVEQFGADVVILDDAFQHRALHRDVDVVLLDRNRPFGNRSLLPAGTLREPLKALRRSDIVVLTGIEGSQMESSQRSLVEGHTGHVPIFDGYRRPKNIIKADMGHKYPLDYLYGKKVCAFAGIAEPEYFETMITALSGYEAEFIPFPDHHVYTTEDIEKIKNISKECSAQLILTTEKDAIKLIDFEDFCRNIYVLRIEMSVSPFQDTFLNTIQGKLGE
ncbi:MAG: tetraacyldisaccharide 4'-kinase [Deltaproteobacteria bacterium]|nr:tetraacyldisaccharide 4'-kinase [Deltaproteobacteria bacterium]